MAKIPGGGTMAYPPTWKQVSGDAGTATAAVFDSEHHVIGYLNLTPRQGGETLQNWPRFRVDHNGDEGDHAIKTLAAGTGLRFRDGRGSCVHDSYESNRGAPYIEIACLVSGKKSSVVIVGASTPQAAGRIGPLLERSISSVGS